MLQTHQKLRASSIRPLTATPARTAGTSVLTLPEFDRAIPGHWSWGKDCQGLNDAAIALADAGILLPEHWQDNSLQSSVSNAISALGDRLLPNPLTEYTLLLGDQSNKQGLGLCWDESSYPKDKHLPDGTQVGALAVTFDIENICHRLIGPAIQQLEDHHAGLGHTVLFWLNTSFQKSSRAVTPVTGIDWARHNYWMGEDDEAERVEEEMDFARNEHAHQQSKLPPNKRVPFDEAAALKNVELFRKADYDAMIPEWAGSKFSHKPKLSLQQLARFRSKFPAVIPATLAAASLLEELNRKKLLNGLLDNSMFDSVHWEPTPYLLRWSFGKKKMDSLGQIYDDYMNEMMNTGEIMLDVNAVFAFHDGPSLVRAIRRFEIYGRVLNAAENLLATIAPDNL